MATTMVKDTTNAKWKLTETGHSGQTYTKTIKCGGTYMEYDVDISVTAAAGSATTPSTSVDVSTDTTISVAANGTITATVGKTQSVTPTVVAGYVSSGVAGDVVISGTKTYGLTTKSATTYTPGTSDQTVNVSGSTTGFFVTGTQTIKGDANLIASNIKSGVSIFGVLGTLTSIAIDDPNTPNAAVAQILTGYEAFDKNGNTLAGTMPDYTGVDLTSSITSGKTMTLTYNSSQGLYTIKMYAGSTGYVLKDSTFITDTVAASTLDKSSITPSLSQQVATITAGYYPSDRTVTIAAMTQGAVTTPATTITVSPSIGSYVSGSGYPMQVSKTQAITPTVTTAGYIGTSDPTSGTITVVDDSISYIAQSTLSSSTVTPNVNGTSKTVTVSAGYYPTDRTVTVEGVSAGSITLSASVTSSIVPTDSNGNSYSIGTSTQPTGSNYIKLTPSANGTASSTFTPGYIGTQPSNAAVSNQPGTALYLNVYDGTIE